MRNRAKEPPNTWLGKRVPIACSPGKAPRSRDEGSKMETTLGADSFPGRKGRDGKAGGGHRRKAPAARAGRGGKTRSKGRNTRRTALRGAGPLTSENAKEKGPRLEGGMPDCFKRQNQFWLPILRAFVQENEFGRLERERRREGDGGRGRKVPLPPRPQ